MKIEKNNEFDTTTQYHILPVLNKVQKICSLFLLDLFLLAFLKTLLIEEILFLL